MRRISRFILATILCLVPLAARGDDPTPAVGQKVLVVFTTPKCDLCEKFKTVTLADPKVKQALEDYLVLTVDTTEEEGARLAARFAVTGFPTILAGRALGKVQARIDGYVGPDELLGILKNVK